MHAGYQSFKLLCAEDVTPSCVEDAWENLKDRLLLGVEMFDNVFE